MKKIEEKEKAEALLWYKRKMAVTEDINIEAISSPSKQIRDTTIVTVNKNKMYLNNILLE